MKKLLVLATAIVCLNATASKVFNAPKNGIKKEYVKPQVKVHATFKSTAGCTFEVEGEVTGGFFSQPTFHGTITIGGPNPPCPKGVHTFAFTVPNAGNNGNARPNLVMLEGDNESYKMIHEDKQLRESIAEFIVASAKNN
jgi:hypothetical protein